MLRFGMTPLTAVHPHLPSIPCATATESTAVITAPYIIIILSLLSSLSPAISTASIPAPKYTCITPTLTTSATPVSLPPPSLLLHPEQHHQHPQHNHHQPQHQHQHHTRSTSVSADPRVPIVATLFCCFSIVHTKESYSPG